MKKETLQEKEEQISPEEQEEIEYRKLKLSLVNNKNQNRRSLIIILLFDFILLPLNFATSYLHGDSIDQILLSIIMILLMQTAVFAIDYFCFERKQNKIRRQILEYEAKHIQAEMEDNMFENSLKMSYKYLDQYYLQTREHAQNGFIITVCIAVSGTLLIFVGIVLMFMEKTQPSYITCASGILTEFISSIFFYLYNKTVSSMNDYHDKLVLSQNISIALKVADSLEATDKTDAKKVIINELLKDFNFHLVKNESADKIKPEEPANSN